MILPPTTKLLSLAICAAAASTSSVALADTTTTTTTTTTTSGSSSSSGATDGGESLVSLGLRGGFSTPYGNIETGERELHLKDRQKGAILVQADLDFRIFSWLHAGVYGGLGFGLIGDQFRDKPCSDSDADCSSYTWLAGAQAEVRLLPNNAFDPWIGVNLGVDGVSQKAESEEWGKDNVSAWGVDVGASAGLDINFDHFAVGPFVSALAGRYGSTNFKYFRERGVETRDNRLVGRSDEHYFITAGIRGHFGL